MTAAERCLWSRLRRDQLGHKFRTQYAIGRYIADFACIRARLVIEVDGETHADDEAERSDTQRSACLEKCGYRVVRFWNTSVFNETDAVVGAIFEALEPTLNDTRSSGPRLGTPPALPIPPSGRPHPDPPPAGGGKLYLTEGSQVGRCVSKAPISTEWRSTRVISSRPFSSMSRANASISNR
jgi:very-short-patch-repair endonuclease